jgi:hypothetical protein
MLHSPDHPIVGLNTKKPLLDQLTSTPEPDAMGPAATTSSWGVGLSLPSFSRMSWDVGGE